MNSLFNTAVQFTRAHSSRDLGSEQFKTEIAVTELINKNSLDIVKHYTYRDWKKRGELNMPNEYRDRVFANKIAK